MHIMDSILKNIYLQKKTCGVTMCFQRKGKCSENNGKKKPPPHSHCKYNVTSACQ